MTAADYKLQRKLRGTQASVAAQLGVGQVTIARRETGGEITREAWLALLSLPKKRKSQIGGPNGAKKNQSSTAQLIPSRQEWNKTPVRESVVNTG